jgi:isopenicillin N synthase-like dioxygenase
MYLLQTGDMVNVWTRNQYKATRHRVIHQKNTFRVSVPFFFEPNIDAVVRPLTGLRGGECSKMLDEDDGGDKDVGIVYGLHLMSKVSTNFKY